MHLTKELLHTTDSYIRRLEQGGIITIKDFITHFPRALKDKSAVEDRFSRVDIRLPVTLKMHIETMTEERTRNGKKVFKMILSDADDFMCEAVWFGQVFLAKRFTIGDAVIVHGKVKSAYGRISLAAPDIEPVSTAHAIGLTYAEVQGIPSRWFEEKMPIMRRFMENYPQILPEAIRKTRNFRPEAENIMAIHFPASVADYQRAQHELGYAELFAMQYAGILRRNALREETQDHTFAIPIDVEYIRTLVKLLPFELTDNQKTVLFRILKDMEQENAMWRLLQGDVGTGKTAVAFLAMVHAWHVVGVQSALLVPTEVLARQHFEGFEALFTGLGIRADLLVGSMSAREKSAARARLATGQTNVLVGTHALLQETVTFHTLGFVVVDEQHRFGVKQRDILERTMQSQTGEGDNTPRYPHVLNMTATPIPRTLALTVAGDQDISILSEYPAGRKPIATRVVWDSERAQVYAHVEQEMLAGRQIYWISPLVEDSEALDVASAETMFLALKERFSHFSVGLLHGRLNSAEKQRIITAFMQGEIQLLSSTSVVEVGVNNPNATVMAIEGAERFGLSQLHQFRGRVGRSSQASYCYLFPSAGSHNNDRLRAMERTNDGFELAEIDLELRGPGEVYGFKQSGLPDFKVADMQDLELVEEIREDITHWLSQEKGL